MGDLVSSVADIFGFGPASIQADATTQAANISAAAQNQALALQQRMYEEGIARQKPYYEAGTNALAKMQEQYGNMPAAFTGRVNLGQDPGYAFRMSEGMKALERSAAARGGLLSGGTGKALTRYGQEMGSQEYQNAYNRALTEYNANVQRESTGYNRLASLAGIGQTTAQQLGAAGSNYANQANQLAMTNAANQGNLALAGGNIRASQYGSAGSALNTALNTDWNALARKFSFGGYGGGGIAGSNTGASDIFGISESAIV